MSVSDKTYSEFSEDVKLTGVKVLIAEIGLCCVSYLCVVELLCANARIQH